MKTSTTAMTPHLSQSTLCATLATLTTFGIFSLIATVMPPLLAGSTTLASSPDAVCAPTASAQAPHVGGHAAI